MIAYCGPAAVPTEFWSRWNGDPVLLAVLAGMAIAVGRGHSSNARAGWGAHRADARHFRLAALRARVGAVLGAGTAPCPAGCCRGASPGVGLSAAPGGLAAAGRRLSWQTPIILWLWHAPAAYEWGLASVPAYWLMQVSLLGSAWLMWRAILAPAAPPGPVLVALATTIGQMGLLGALIVFAPRPLYLVHLTSTAPWGLEPAGRPAAWRAADVGAGDAALSGRGALVRMVQPSSGRAAK